MNAELRPRYVSYLPPAYVDRPDGFLARFVAMLECLMSGAEPRPNRLLESWVALDELPTALIPETAAADDPADPRPLRFDRQARRLIHIGPMSEAARDALIANFTGLPPDEAAALTDLVKRLHARSTNRVEALPGLEQILDDIARYSDPYRAPAPMAAPDADGIPDQGFFDDDFLSYLAHWVGLTLTASWPDVKKRRLIHNIVPLYKRRGTLDGLRRFLEIFVDGPVAISEELGIQVGVRATVDLDTTVGGIPHMFNVDIRFGFGSGPGPAPTALDFDELRRIRREAGTVIDLEKPAHTDYRTRYLLPGFVVGAYSTVGRDTLMLANTDPVEIDKLILPGSASP